jgi:hypothetical protein
MRFAPRLSRLLREMGEQNHAEDRENQSRGHNNDAKPKETPSANLKSFATERD